MAAALRQLVRARGAGTRWLWFYAFLVVAWIAMAAMHLDQSDLRGMKEVYGVDAWVALCAAGILTVDPLTAMAFWAVMAAAMMAPTLVPALRVLDDLIEGGHTQSASFATFLTGYLGVWVLAAALGASLQIALANAGQVDALGESTNAWLTAGLLAFAGLYQFSTLKASCLSKCRQPLTFFMAHWSRTPLEMGARMGVICLGCCWALMLLAFVGGMSSLAIMGLATLIMTLEKLPDIGRYVSPPLGGALIGAAIWSLI